MIQKVMDKFKIRSVTNLILYHGSNVLVDEPKILESKKGLDFGSGFYLTSSYEQAERWAQLKTERLEKGKAIVSVFEINDDKLSSLKTITYPKADRSWLGMIVQNRRNPSYNSGYDVMIGPVADDDTVLTLKLYFRNAFTEEETLRRLLPQKLKDQYAFKTENSLSDLKFLRGDVI